MWPERSWDEKDSGFSHMRFGPILATGIIHVFLIADNKITITHFRSSDYKLRSEPRNKCKIFYYKEKFGKQYRALFYLFFFVPAPEIIVCTRKSPSFSNHNARFRYIARKIYYNGIDRNSKIIFLVNYRVYQSICSCSADVSVPGSATKRESKHFVA